jgi:hypothetical protein
MTRGSAQAVPGVISGCGDDDNDDQFRDAAGAGASAGASDNAGSGNSSAGSGGASAGSGNSSAGSGNSSAGSGNSSAGSGGAPLLGPIDPELQARCLDLYAQQASLQCQEDTFQVPQPGCDAIARLSQCKNSLNEFFDCADGNQAICDSNGDVAYPGCELSQAQALGCALSELADPAFRSACEAACARKARTMCTNDETLQECTYGCRVTAGLFPQCSEVLRDGLECSVSATYTCDDEGDAQNSDCGEHQRALFACLLTKGPGERP